MTTERRELTFAQRMGIDPLPTQARQGQISDKTRARLWAVILDWLLQGAQSTSFSRVPARRTSETLLRWWVNHKERMVDEIPSNVHDWQDVLKSEMMGNYVSVFNLVQFLLSDSSFSRKKALADVLDNTMAAYRSTENVLHPFASKEEVESIKGAFQETNDRKASGAESHLRAAAAELTSGNWAGSVHESVSAVESAARFVRSDEKGVLSSLVKDMRKSGEISHPCLADAISKIYNYASDEKGVRHSHGALETANVSEREAMFVFGMCASMVSFVLSAQETDK